MSLETKVRQVDANLALPDRYRKTLEEFWNAIGPRLPGYKHAGFSYLAVRRGSDFLLIQGRLHLLAEPQFPSLEPFESQNVKAGHWKLDIEQRPEELINKLLSGEVKTPSGDLVFPSDQSQNYSVYFNPHAGDGVSNNRRRLQLAVDGSNGFQYLLGQHDWELKAHHKPFNSIGDLCKEYGIPEKINHNAHVDVLADIVAAVHPESTIKDSQALIKIKLAEGLEPGKAALGYATRKNESVTDRRQVSCGDIKWSKAPHGHLGLIQFSVPTGAVLDCVANYAGEAHHVCTVTDPSTTPNTGRAILQAFDADLERLNELLVIQGKGKEARDFEKSVSWIFWMMGFSVAHLDAIPKANGAPDLVAKTSDGKVMVIECTTGLLKAEQKLPNLVARTEKIKTALAKSGHRSTAVLPVLITNRTLAEVKAEIDDAIKVGIFLITSDDFPHLLKLAGSSPDPDRFFKNAEEKVALALTPDPFSQLFAPPKYR